MPTAATTPVGSRTYQATISHGLVDLFASLGARHLFGVPGDYSLPLLDAADDSGRLAWVGACNELNGAYMADGAARVTGLSVLSTTWGVGELSALNAVAGAYAERVPIVHVIGMPSTGALGGSALIHHTMRGGDPLASFRMSAMAACDSTIVTHENALAETERLTRRAMQESRPVVIGLPMDVARSPLPGATHGASGYAPSGSHAVAGVDPLALDEAAAAIAARLGSSKRACVLVGALVVRLGQRAAALKFIEQSGLPFATMWMDKSALDESHPQYCGMYHGRLAEESVRAFVEGCDTIVNLGALWSDVNSGAFTAALDRGRCILVDSTHVQVGAARYDNVPMGALLARLATIARSPIEQAPPVPKGLGDPVGSGDATIEPAAFFPRCEKFIRPNDVCFVETGTISMGLAPARMARGADFVNQALWGSIGWATPAAVGAALANPGRRAVLFTGEGAFQCTCQELGTAARHGAKLIVFVVNNDGYLTERLLSANTEMRYNDLAPWRYTALPAALGCEGWFTARAATCAELDDAMERASLAPGSALIEVVMPGRALPPIGTALRDAIHSLYRTPA